MTRHARLLCRGVAVAWSLFLTWLLAATVATRLPSRARRALSCDLAGHTLAALRARVCMIGSPAPGDGPMLLVANHVSWLDVYALGALWPARFVAKHETRNWPIVGTIARRFDALFIVRGSCRDAARVRAAAAAALVRGESIVVFPEGTTTDGTRLGRFHTALFQAAVDAGVRVQPVALRYTGPDGRPCPAAPFVGEDTLVASLLRVLRAPALRIELRVGPPLPSSGRSRRALAADAQAIVAHALGLPAEGLGATRPDRAARRVASAA